MIVLDTISLILMIIGGLNWGLMGLFEFDLVSYLFGGNTVLISRIIYSLIGLASIWGITLLFRRGDDHHYHDRIDSK